MSTTHQSDSQWVSLSDLMTGLMLVFLFLSVLFIHQWQKQFVDYQDMRQQLYEDLDDAFRDKYSEWNMELQRDLTIKFKNPDVLFAYRSAKISAHFSQILEEFLPIYLQLLTKPEYQNSIAEVRIEGHTADWDDYLYTIQLSQNRANAVLEYLLGTEYFVGLEDSDKSQIKFWMTATGYGNGRAIDSGGNFVHESGLATSPDSRRVEFRIVTESEELIERVTGND